MRRNRKAKIVATLGPASASPDMIEALAIAGVDVFRMNFSHGAQSEHKRTYQTIRAVEAKLGTTIGILGDLQGPKLRVGRFADGSVMLTKGASFRLTLKDVIGDQDQASLPHKEIFQAIETGADLLLDDGRIRLKVEKYSHDFAETRIIQGGRLSNNKGVNIPNVTLPISALTAKDRDDLAFALELGVDWVALSFVQRPEDVEEIRSLVQGRARILCKLEKPAAITHLEEIVALSDAIMVARGDLGVECPPETVPVLQKRIVRTAREAGKPVIVATQMLESMISAPTPTRAEASDVATAIYDGADAVMLSAETAVGEFPIDAVTIMSRIISNVEEDSYFKELLESSRVNSDGSVQDAIAAAARQVAHSLELKAIITFTASGSTTLKTARERPNVPLLCLTTSEAVAHQMTLVWGAHSLQVPEVYSFSEMTALAVRAAEEQGFAQINDRVVIIAGMPFGAAGTTNILRVARIGDPQ